MIFDPTLLAIFLVSAFTMSFAGFGFAMVSVPLLALLLPIKEAVALQFPFCMLLFAIQGWVYRRHFRWDLAKPMVVGSVVGMTLGALLLYQLPEVALKRSLAVFTAAAVLFNLTPLGRRAAQAYAGNHWWGRACGFLSGAFFGAYTIGGPPAAVYIISVGANPREMKAFLACYFTIQFMFIAVFYAWSGMFSWWGARVGLSMIPVVALGALAGVWFFRRASNLVYRRVVNLMLLATAISLWLRA